MLRYLNTSDKWRQMSRWGFSCVAGGWKDLGLVCWYASLVSPKNSSFVKLFTSDTLKLILADSIKFDFQKLSVYISYVTISTAKFYWPWWDPQAPVLWGGMGFLQHPCTLSPFHGAALLLLCPGSVFRHPWMDGWVTQGHTMGTLRAPVTPTPHTALLLAAISTLRRFHTFC